jgi:hypothetical protein
MAQDKQIMLEKDESRQNAQPDGARDRREDTEHQRAGIDWHPLPGRSPGAAYHDNVRLRARSIVELVTEFLCGSNSGKKQNNYRLCKLRVPA